MIRPPPSSALFPYTTLFRSYVVLSVSFQMRLASLSAPIRYAELARTLDVPLESRVEASEVRGAGLTLRRSRGMVLDPADHDTGRDRQSVEQGQGSALARVTARHRRSCAREPGAAPHRP